MAFFGADSLEHQIKQLKAVAAQKGWSSEDSARRSLALLIVNLHSSDSQLTTLLNEQHKKQELFDENKRAKDDALYRVSHDLGTILNSRLILLVIQVQAEADRADKAEKALALKAAVRGLAAVRPGHHQTNSHILIFGRNCPTRS